MLGAGDGDSEGLVAGAGIRCGSEMGMNSQPPAPMKVWWWVLGYRI